MISTKEHVATMEQNYMRGWTYSQTKKPSMHWAALPEAEKQHWRDQIESEKLLNESNKTTDHERLIHKAFHLLLKSLEAAAPFVAKRIETIYTKKA